MKKDKQYFKNLDVIAKGLYNIAVRSGPIEDYHAMGCPIDDKEMETLNRFAFNRIGYMMDLLFSGQIDKFCTLCQAEAVFLSYFDPLDLNSVEVQQLEEEYNLIKKFDD